jgi:hypothetical protein
LKASLTAKIAASLKRHFVRVDVVIGAVNDIDVGVDHLVTADDAVEHRFFDALLSRPGCIPSGYFRPRPCSRS